MRVVSSNRRLLEPLIAKVFIICQRSNGCKRSEKYTTIKQQEICSTLHLLTATTIPMHHPLYQFKIIAKTKLYLSPLHEPKLKMHRKGAQPAGPLVTISHQTLSNCKRFRIISSNKTQSNWVTWWTKEPTCRILPLSRLVTKICEPYSIHPLEIPANWTITTKISTLQNKARASCLANVAVAVEGNLLKAIRLHRVDRA